MSCNSTQLPALPFCVPHTKMHGVIGLIRHYHLLLEPKLRKGICAILRIPCERVACKEMLDKPWSPGLSHTKQPCY